MMLSPLITVIGNRARDALLAAGSMVLALGLGVGPAASGLEPGAQIVKVTTLADRGPGSLRAALTRTGPSIIVFEVGGYIELADDLEISRESTVIAGETAPGSGIVLRGGNLRIRASNAVVSNIAVFPGSTSDVKKAESRDAISIYGSPKRKRLLRNITLHNVTAGWGVDENIGVQGLVDGLRVERSLIAEGLRYGGHPKGSHSMNLVLGNTVRRVEIVGNVFAASEWRSARMTQGNLASMINNLIVDYGAAATQIDPTSEILNAGSIDVIGNAYMPGPESYCRRPIVDIHPNFLSGVPTTTVHLADNIAIGSRQDCGHTPLASSIVDGLARSPAEQVTGWSIVPASSLFPSILDNAGSRPLARNPIDQRIIAAIRDGHARLIDNEATIGGWPIIDNTQRSLTLPISSSKLSGAADVAAVSKWLCDMRHAVGDKASCM